MEGIIFTSISQTGTGAQREERPSFASGSIFHRCQWILGQIQWSEHLDPIIGSGIL